MALRRRTCEERAWRSGVRRTADQNPGGGKKVLPEKCTLLERNGKREEIFDEEIWNASESFYKAQTKMQRRNDELEARAKELGVTRKGVPSLSEESGEKNPPSLD